MKKQFYIHSYESIVEHPKKGWKKFCKWVKKHPKFEGEINVYRWFDGQMQIDIISENKMLE